MDYPREVKLENEELKVLIEEKSKLVLEGRIKSEEVEKLENEMNDVEKQLIEEEKKVDLSEFQKKEKAITKRMEKCIKDMDAIRMAIFAKIKEQTPQELRDKYEEVKKQKEEKETERNKVALAAQKYNDKIIPIGRDLIKPFLQDEYEDYDTVQVKDGQLVATIFSHLEDYKTKFNITKNAV